MKIAVAQLPIGKAIARDRSHLHVDGQQVVAGMGTVAADLLDEHLGVEALAQQPPVVVGEADDHGLDLVLRDQSAQLLEIEHSSLGFFRKMTTLLPRDFHPVIQRWWASRFAAPTAAQLEGWSAIRRGEHTLIAAPTGSGKTLAAFLTAIDRLLREAKEQGGLPDEVRVIYVSPLKALSADIHKNLAEPRREIRGLAESLGYPSVKITAAVRSGDTPRNERAAMLRTPPHILVTTPESLYLLLTAERSRAMLRTARVVVVDEIHAVVQSRRGAHLSLSLERLDHVCGRPLQRIG